MSASRKGRGRLVVSLTLAAALLTCVLLTACSQPDAQVEKGLPSWATEEGVTVWAHEVVDEFNARDYEALAARYQDAGVTADQLSQNLSAAQDEYGAFVEYGDKTFLHGESKGRSYATVIEQASYENGSAEFRVSFFVDGSLAGFYFLKAKE